MDSNQYHTNTENNPNKFIKISKSIELAHASPTIQTTPTIKKMLSHEQNGLNYQIESSTTGSLDECTMETYQDAEVLQFLKPHIHMISLIDRSKVETQLQFANIYLLNKPTKSVLILDLDGTLLKNDNGSIELRPYLFYFLHTLKKVYNLWVWTAGDWNYLLHAIGIIDPERCIFDCLLERSYCTMVNGVAVKDIRMFENLELNRVVMMDDQLISFITTLNNGILVSYYQGGDDTELLKWCEFLLGICGENLPDALNRYFHLKECVHLLL
jgi:hypothetical protein